jgi:D-alanyl-D-alanine carboxypeptidase
MLSWYLSGRSPPLLEMLKSASVFLLTASRLALGLPATAACPAWFNGIGEKWLSQAPDIPGIQMSVWSPKCSLHCKDSWVSPYENYTANPPLLINTPYRLASATKPFTALAVLKLVEDGIVDVNGSVIDYIPDWAVATLEQQQGAENASQITPWMLMHHTAGLTNHADDIRYISMFLEDPNAHLTHRELLEWAAEHSGPRDVPGGSFWYSDTGFAYLGAIIEHVTGESIAAVVRRAAHLDELCMRSTYWEVFEDPPKGTPARAGQYYGTVDTTNIDASHGLYGGAGLVSRSEDMIKFARAFHRGLLLKEETMELVYTTVPMDDVVSYGCGWMTQLVAGWEAWYHRGTWGTWMYYLPELDLAVAGALNQAAQIKLMPLILEDVVQHVQDWGCVA